MDTSWMRELRHSKAYLDGVKYLLDSFYSYTPIGEKCPCPCKKCVNLKKWDRDEVEGHFVWNGIMENYTKWIYHDGLLANSGVLQNNNFPFMEPLIHDNNSSDLMNELLHAAIPNLTNNESLHEQELPYDGIGVDTYFENPQAPINVDANNLYTSLLEENKPLWEGCQEYTKLSFLLNLLHIKTLENWSNIHFDMLLKVLQGAIPGGYESVPANYHEAKKITSKLGHKYIKIDACENDCSLFWDVHKNDNACHVCGQSRWVEVQDDQLTHQPRKRKQQDMISMRKTAKKVFRYFPLKERLERLFLCKQTAEMMQWHAKELNHDSFMHHPRDGLAWKDFDQRHKEFSSDPRNIRLGLATDGFNPFGDLSSTHSTWPIMLVIYNVPPWECMKKRSIIMSGLIPRPKMSGNYIDVYLQPLVKELNELWHVGVEVFDASDGKKFTLHAALLWTISDFPALGNLSGWNTHSKLGCPSCGLDTQSCWLKNSQKIVYQAHRRFLPVDHPYRKARKFGRHEVRIGCKKPPNGRRVSEATQNLQVVFGRTNQLGGPTKYWKKRSIFFDLPYWKTNLLCHCLDTMHIEKNVCDNILNTILGDPIKSKDNVRARRDCKDLGILKHLWLQERDDDTEIIPPACFTMSKTEKDTFLGMIKSLRVPDGYASNISRCVKLKQCRIQGLKSHDNHIIMQQLLSIGLRSVLSRHIVSPLMEVSMFFRELCSKRLNVSDLLKIEDRIILALCHLELIFPPSFFTVMIHLMVHLSQEAILGGPVQFRWMYPIERELGHYKKYVRNKAKPEGSIAEGYIAEENLTFCSRFLEGIETRFNRPSRNSANSTYPVPAFRMLPQVGSAIRGVVLKALDPVSLLQAHRYILFNCVELEVFRSELREELKSRCQSLHIDVERLENLLHKEFSEWFRQRVDRDGAIVDDPQLRQLALGPNSIVRSYKGYNINGFSFRTVASEIHKRTQNSGVEVMSNHDESQDDINYFGRITEIIELDYFDFAKVMLFKCDWVNPTKNVGVKKDFYGFTLVNFTNLIHTGAALEHDPYIFPSQAIMVYYIRDPTQTNWELVIRMVPRDEYEMGDIEATSVDDHENFIQCVSNDIQNIQNAYQDDEGIEMVRTDVEPRVVEREI